MAVKKVYHLPNPLPAIRDSDYLMLSQYDAANGHFVSVKCTAGEIKAFLSGGSGQISCDGATNTVITGGIWQANNFFINGELIPGDPSDRIEIDNTYETRWPWRNLTGSNLRVRIEADPAYITPNDYGWVENTNPTLSVDFETGVIEFCLAPAADCTPSEPVQLLGSRNTPLTDPETQVTHNKLDYRLNGGPIQTFVASSEATTLEGFLDELQGELGQVAPDTDHWIFGNNAQGPAIMYETDFNNPVIIRPSGKTGEYDTATTLELILIDRPGDFVNYFISDTVILHACGVFGFA